MLRLNSALQIKFLATSKDVFITLEVRLCLTCKQSLHSRIHANLLPRTYQPLIKAYIGQCLRKDLELLEEETITAFIASLERHGVNNDTIQEALLVVCITE